MKRLFARLLPGFTTAACAVTGATLAVSAFDADLHWFGAAAALRVGLPAFIAGLLFFPVDWRALKSRLGFTFRALTAAAASCAAHRVLLWSARADGESPLSLWPTLGGDGPLGLDVTAWLAVLAVGGAAATAWLAQPALLRLASRPARGLLGRPVSPLPQPDAPRVGPARIRS